MQKIIVTALLMALSCGSAFCQLTAKDSSAKETVSSIIRKDPLLIMDGATIIRDSLKNTNPEDIADITVLKEKTATVLYGDKGKNGAIIIETKKFARAKYIKFLRDSSAQYDSLYRQAGSDSSFQYVLNGKALKQNTEGSLAALSSQKLMDVKILNRQQLKDSLGIDDKQYGVVIISEEKNAAGEAH